MRRFTVILSASGLTALLLIGSDVSAAGSLRNWRITNLGLLPGLPSVDYFSPAAINANGELVGQAQSPVVKGKVSVFRAFAWRNGVMTLLKGGADASAINDEGVIVGDPAIAVTTAASVGLLWRNADATPVKLGTLGGNSSSSVGINDRGQVVGNSKTANGQEHAFLWQAGKMRDLGTLGGQMAQALAINNTGEVLGVSTTAIGLLRGFVWQNGQMTDLGPKTSPTAINDSGEVVGAITDPYGNPIVAFSWRNGRLTKLRYGKTFLAQAVNDKGEILMQPNREAGGFLLVGGKKVPITSPGLSITGTTALNNLGQVTGVCFTNDGARRTYVWQNGRATVLPTYDGIQPPWGSPVAINNRGQVIGTSYLDDRSAAVIWAPQP